MCYHRIIRGIKVARTEEEAYEIIKSEAESYGGIAFARESPPVLEDVKLPESRLFNGQSAKRQPVRNGDL